MRKTKFKICYYDQTSADVSLPVPGQGYGGWKKTELDFDLDTTAVIVMHAIDYGTPEKYPGMFRSCEYMPRAIEIDRVIFPPLMSAIRKSGLKVIHVGYNGPMYVGHENYVNDGVECTYPWINSGETTRAILQFKNDYNFPGKENHADRNRSCENLDFLPNARPVPGESIVINTNQLFKLCQKEGVDHLLYIGYCVDACIQAAPCGMVDMMRRGFLCTIIREATTAVENKETSEHQLTKERALTGIGLIFSLDDFLEGLNKEEC
ncbi:MAG: isochorismatase family protein [Oscillospiraceae bacterium]|nr:isochorismatase family protein [Oscillospiraceae bacterium]